MSDSPSLLESLFTAGDAGDVDSFGLYLHDDVVVHAPAGLSTVGIEEEKASWRKAKAAIPDLHHEFVDVLRAESSEAARTVVSGTMSGTYGGLSAKGRHFSTDQAVFARVRDGKISEMWEIVDVSAIGSQIAGTGGEIGSG
jgi:predicted ester cyclase